MRKNKVISLLIIINLLLIGVCLKNNSNIVLSGEKQIIKEMTEIEYESKLTELNKSHEDYATNVQNYKKQIAEAITNQGVSTSEDATSSEIAKNIEKIFETRTSNADATAANITKGKKAYVNGELVTGTGVDNDNSYNNGYNEGKSENKGGTVVKTLVGEWTTAWTDRQVSRSFSCTSIDGWENLTADNFGFICTGLLTYFDGHRV